MQVSVEDLSSVKKVMHIEVPQEDVARELDQAYKDLKKNTKMKGFRPGKAPRSVLETRYGKSVTADITQKLVQQALLDALKETGLNPVGPPLVDPPELDVKAPYKFDATIEIHPQLEDLEYKGLELFKTNYEATDREINAQLKMIQNTIGQKVLVEKDRPVENSDFAVIDYEVTKAGRPVAEIPAAENFTLKVGAGAIHQDLDEQIVGMKKGESKTIPVTFPQQHANESIAGATIDFRVTLKEIREQQLDEIDDAFAKKLGTFETLEDLKNGIRKNLLEGYEKRTEQELNEQIFQALLKKCDFEVPEHLVNMELEHIINDIEKKLESHDKSMEDVGFTREGLAEKHRDTAEKQVKRWILLDKLIEQEKIELSGEELDKGFEEMAESFKQPSQVLKKYYESSPEQLNLFKRALLEKKAIKLIIDNSSIVERKPEQETAAEME